MNISLSEIIVILLVALLVIKPEQLPELTFTLGRFVKTVRHLIGNVKKEMQSFANSIDKINEQKREQ